MEWRLRAAEAFRRGGDLESARQTLDELDPRALTQDQALRAGIVRTDAALAAGLPEDALNFLPDLTPDIQGERRAEILALRLQAFRAMESNVDAMLDALQLQRLAPDPQQRTEIEDIIWSLMAAMDIEALQSLASLDPALPGWIALQDVAAIGLDQQQRFQARIAEWQQSYPGHPAAQRASELAAARTGARVPSQLALLLPLSGRYARVSEDIRDGFLTGNSIDANASPAVRVYDIANMSAADAYRQAVIEGAALVVGPLLKENIETLAVLPDRTVPILALNRMSDGRRVESLTGPGTPEAAPIEQLPLAAPEPAPVMGAMPSRSSDHSMPMYQFGLAPEDDAEQVAARALDQGMERALALYPEDDWGQRIYDAFLSRFTRGGGRVVGTRSYVPGSADFTAPIRDLLHLDASDARHRDLEQMLGTRLEFEPRRRRDADFLFLVANAAQGRLLYPQLRFYRAGDLATWSTSHIFTGGVNSVSDRDLDGVEFCDIPWLLSPDRLPTELQSASVVVDPAKGRSRLFALGLDAYRLVPWLTALESAQGLSIDGATGRLSVDAEGVVHRQDLVWARFASGVPRLVGTPTSQLPPAAEAD